MNSLFDINEEGRECTNCLEFKSWDKYQKNGKAGTGHQSICKTCRTGINNGTVKKQNGAKIKCGVTDKGRLCRKCDVWKEWQLFAFQKTPANRKEGDDYYNRASTCKPCVADATLFKRKGISSRSELKPSETTFHGYYREEALKKKEKHCKKCEKLLPFSDFNRGNSLGNRLSICRKCQSDRHRMQMDDLVSPEGRAKLMVRNISSRKNDPRYDEKYKDIEISILPEDLLPLPSHCPILEVELDYLTSERTWNSPTLDKVMPERGYTRGNVEIISDLANRIKNDAQPHEILKVYEWLSDYYKKNNIQESERVPNIGYKKRSSKD